MDFDIGNLVYILITVAFIIFSAIGKKKKRPVQPKVQQVEKERNIAERLESNLSEKLKSMFGEFIDQDSSIDEIEEEIDESVYGYVQDDSESENVDYEEKLDSIYSKLDTVNDERGVSSTMEYNKNIEPHNAYKNIRTSASRFSYVEEALEDFDAKKAILFSEIFKPKYF